MLAYRIVMSFVIILHFSGRGDYWYNTLCVFPFGMIYSLMKAKIEEVMRNTKNYILVMLSIVSMLGVIIAFNLFLLFLL